MARDMPSITTPTRPVARVAGSTTRVQSVAHALITHLAAALLILSAILVAFPFIWMIHTSLMPEDEVLQFPPVWIPSHLTLQHYMDALTFQPFGRYIVNSFIVAVTSTAGQLLTASMGAYAFARLRFPGRDKLFLLYLGTMMIPYQVTLIPQYVLISKLGWLNNYLALIVPSLGSAFSTFLLRQFFLSIPREMEEAAKIDGAGYMRIYATIILPLAKPALATVSLLTFMSSWTSFVWPLVVIQSTEMRTIPVGLAALQQQAGASDIAQIMAGAVMALVPMFVLFIFLQRYFIESIASSGLKG
jgi:multiple sugar transport system permease protein